MGTATAWAVIKPNGDVEVSSNWGSPHEALKFVLGWPTFDEINDRMKKGWKVRQVTVTWEDDD